MVCASPTKRPLRTPGNHAVRLSSASARPPGSSGIPEGRVWCEISPLQTRRCRVCVSFLRSLNHYPHPHPPLGILNFTIDDREQALDHAKRLLDKMQARKATEELEEQVGEDERDDTELKTNRVTADSIFTQMRRVEALEEALQKAKVQHTRPYWFGDNHEYHELDPLPGSEESIIQAVCAGSHSEVVEATERYLKEQQASVTTTLNPVNGAGETKVMDTKKTNMKSGVEEWLTIASTKAFVDDVVYQMRANYLVHSIT